MLGLMNDCLEKLVISKFGFEVWDSVKERAGCEVQNDGFMKLESYHDDATVVLVECVSELTGLPMDDVYRLFGSHFVHYIMQEGYENVLYCHGRTLKEWMTSINSLHNHLQTTFPNSIVAPEFWCEENYDGTLSLFYRSARGSVWAPYAQGIVTECAKRQFDLSITMEVVSFQEEDGARFTSWIVATENPDDLWKLRTVKGSGDSNAFSGSRRSQTCPFSGMVINMDEERTDPDLTESADSLACGSVTEISLANSPAKYQKRRSDINDITIGRGSISSKSSGSISMNASRSIMAESFGDSTSFERGGFEAGSLSAATTRRLFPYHVVVDQDFSITQVGVRLPSMLGSTEKILGNLDVDEVFLFEQPKHAKWTRSWMRKLQDQEFTLKCILKTAPTKVSFKGTLVETNPGEIMLVLCPEAKNLEELRDMNLTISDLPAHGAYRDAVFLREHLSKQLNNTLKMEKLSKTLQTEKALLESLIPKHAAEGLRKGESVQPRIHHNVTMFFSDIVGFTNICKRVDPREVVDMLNRLYMLMDYVAKKFNIFKIETIGDAYVAASGMPEADTSHAKNVTNFAIAVTHICERVLSPADGAPIKLRIGVNSGRCCSGIVGVTNPRYCVFGDTVNTTARHETTGEAGRVHGSMTTMIELLKQAPDEFLSDSRGMIEMKGKGSIPTYWLSSTTDNPLTNAEALKALDEEVTAKFGRMLKQEECLARQKRKKPGPKTTGMDGKPPQKGVASSTVPSRPPAVLLHEQGDAPQKQSTAPTQVPRNQMSRIEPSCLDTTDDSVTSSASCNSSFVSSYSSSSRSSSSLFSPPGDRCNYIPSKSEMMGMLGQLIDGNAEIDDLVISVRENFDDEKLNGLNDAVDEALRLLDDEDDD